MKKVSKAIEHKMNTTKPEVRREFITKRPFANNKEKDRTNGLCFKCARKWHHHNVCEERKNFHIKVEDD